MSETAARAGARRSSAVDARRVALARSLASRFWLRFHMSVMLFAAFGAGFITSYLLLRAGVVSTLVRWPLGTLVGYLMLFFCMRLWLAYVGVRPLWIGERRADGDAGLGPDLSWPADVGPSGGSVFKGGGGRSGGGGASGSFGDSANPFTSVSKPSGGGKGIGFDLGDVDIGGLLVLVIIVLALTAALLGGVVFLVASAPHLLADVAFGAALTGGIAPAARRVADGDDWSGSVWKATWKPFAIILIVVIAAGLALAHYFPGAATLGDAFRLL